MGFVGNECYNLLRKGQNHTEVINGQAHTLIYLNGNILIDLDIR